MGRPKKVKPEAEVEEAAEKTPEAAVDLATGLKRIKVTHEQLKKLEDEHLLVGYDPSTQEAIIK